MYAQACRHSPLLLKARQQNLQPATSLLHSAKAQLEMQKKFSISAHFGSILWAVMERYSTTRHGTGYVWYGAGRLRPLCTTTTEIVQFLRKSKNMVRPTLVIAVKRNEE